MSVQRWLRARQKDEKRIGFLKTGDKTLRDMLSPLRCAILSIPPEYDSRSPVWKSYYVNGIFTPTPGSENTTTTTNSWKMCFTGQDNGALTSWEKLSTKNFWKSLWVPSSIFRLLKQTPGPFWSFWICKWTRIDWQPTLDGGSQTKQSVVSFSLCRSTEAQHSLHFKRRDPFSRHQRSHHLFWQVLWFPLPLL